MFDRADGRGFIRLGGCPGLLLTAALLLGPARVLSGAVTTVGEIRAMSREEAANHHPVTVTGVVTYHQRSAGILYIQDETGGVFARPPVFRIDDPGKELNDLEPGMQLHLVGVTVAGRIAGYIEAPPGGKLLGRVLGNGRLPPALQLSWTRLLDPQFHNQWVELKAFVTDVQAGATPSIGLLASGYRFRAEVAGGLSEPTRRRLLGSDVRLTGVYSAIISETRQLLGFRLSIPTEEFIQWVDPGLQQAQARPAQGIEAITQFETTLSARARVHGVVLAATSTEIVIRGEGGALWVRTAQAYDVAAGDRVDIMGYPETVGDRVMLIDSVVRPTGEQTAVLPVPVRDAILEEPRLDGELVRIEGRLIAQQSRPDGSLLLIRGDHASFYARTLPESVATWPHYPPNSWLEITGICVPEAATASRLAGTHREPEGNYVVKREKQAATFHVLMRSPADVRILQQPDWWTPTRIALAFASLVLFGILVLGWNFSLRRQVERQTTVIARQLEREKIHDERRRIARELHDSLEQDLSGIDLLARSVARHQAVQAEDLRSSLTMLSALAQHSRDEARRTIWDLRLPGQEQWDLARRLEVMAHESRGNDTGPRVEFTLEGERPRLSAVAEHNLFRIAQEAVGNARKHSGARTIGINLRSHDGQVTLEIRDDGGGFDPAFVSENRVGHFGLQGMRERAEKVGAEFDLASSPGAGTVIRVRLPTIAPLA